MTRTLLISDFHIGWRPIPSTLERARPLEILLEAVRGFDRLILLGDIVEMTATPAAHSMPIAAPILSQLGRALNGDQQVVLVPGNHDREMIARWLAAHSGELTVETVIPRDASQALEQITGWLGRGGAQVEVRYPGVTLSESVWATHGHYLDNHLAPVSPFGLARRRRRLPPAGAVGPAEYEWRRRRQLSAALRVMPRPLARVIEEVADILRAATMPQLKERLLHPRWAPLTAALLGMQTRRHSIPALTQVLHGLGVDAEYVVFGHVHRLGPLPGEPIDKWSAPSGRPQFVNTGSWRYEPLLLGHVVPPHPYWPGGAVILEDGQPPRPVGLLDELAPTDLH